VPESIIFLPGTGLAACQYCIVIRRENFFNINCMPNREYVWHGNLLRLRDRGLQWLRSHHNKSAISGHIDRPVFPRETAVN